MNCRNESRCIAPKALLAGVLDGLLPNHPVGSQSAHQALVSAVPAVGGGHSGDMAKTSGNPTREELQNKHPHDLEGSDLNPYQSDII